MYLSVDELKWIAERLDCTPPNPNGKSLALAIKEAFDAARTKDERSADGDQPATPLPGERSAEDEQASERKTGLAGSVPAAVPRTPAGTIRLLTWNVCKFTCHLPDKPTHERHVERVGLLADELAEQRPTLLFVQEVMAGEGGRLAIVRLTEALNERCSGSGAEYRCCVSQVAGDLPEGTPACSKEVYGVLWDTTSDLGGEEPELQLWTSAAGTPPAAPPFGFCPLDCAELVAARRYAGGQTNAHRGFQRAPLFARFPGAASGLRRTVFCSVHLARKENGAFQVRQESLLLQAALGCGAGGEQPLVLCGDFNEDENGLHDWAEDHKRAGFGEAAPACKRAREAFFAAFQRALLASVGTSIYPIVQDDSHNDNVWVARQHFDTARLDAAVGSTVRVVAQVERMTRLLALAGREGRTRSSEKGTQLCKSLFSDHLPVAVTLAPRRAEPRRSLSERFEAERLAGAELVRVRISLAPSGSREGDSVCVRIAALL